MNLNRILKALTFSIFTSLILASCGGSTPTPDPTPDPTSDPTDTATWSSWSQWSPATNTDTSVISIIQTRTRSCDIAINGEADNPAPTCAGSASETRTITNLSSKVDTATWSVWSQWSPATNTDTSVISIIQTRTRSCDIAINGEADIPAPICVGSASETRTITNPLSSAADTATWSVWSQWSPATNADTSVISIIQTRTRSCDIAINGETDIPAPICVGSASETRTITNPLVAPVAIAPAATIMLAEDSSATITLNGTAIDGTVVALTYQITTQPANGQVTLNGNIATYTPNANYNGGDSFTFTATDGANLTSQPTLVNIAITPVNDAPVASDLLFGFNQNTATITLTASDIDGDTLSYSVVANPHIGVLSGTTANLSYFQDGTVATSFAFVVTDAGGLTATATVTLVNTTLTVAGSSATSITLAWTSDNYFKLYRSNGDTTTLIYQGTNRQYTDTNLTTTTSYSYQLVYCIDANSCGSVMATLDTVTAPNAVTLAAITALSRSQIALSWDAVAGASIYRIYRSTQINGVYTALEPVTSTSITDTGLTASTEYHYQISACTLDNTADSSGTSCSDRNNSSAQGSASTNTKPETDASYNLTFNNSENQINLSWTTNGANFVRISASTATATGFTEIYSGTATSFVNANPVVGISYYYRLQLCSDSSIASCQDLDTVSSQQTATVPDIYDFSNFGQPNSSAFFNLSAASNIGPVGIWSDGVTMWVADITDDKIYAYNLATKARDSSQDFNTLSAASNTAPQGIWSDGTTMWVADNGDDKIYAYNLTTKARDSSQDFNTLSAASNNEPRGIWSDGTTMWVVDQDDQRIYAYNLATKAYDSSQDFNSLDTNNIIPPGIWSNGATMWVTDQFNRKVYAYNLATKAYDSSKDVNLITHRSDAYGIWSDGTTLWVADRTTQPGIQGYYFGFISTVTAQSSTQIALSWNDIAGASIYRIYRSTEVTGVYTQLNSVTSTSTTDAGLDSGTNYYYQIVACSLDNTADSAGTSCSDRNNPTAQASAATIPGSGASYSLTFNNNDTTQVNLSWTTSGANFVRISASTATASGFTEIYSGNATSYTHTNLVAASNYYYRLQLCGDNDIASCLDIAAVSSQQTTTTPDIYDFSNFGQRNSSADFNTLSAAGNNAPLGIWSNATTMWVADNGSDKIYAYNLATKARDSSQDFTNTLTAANNNDLRGIWSDGTTMWVADFTDNKLYAYNLATKVRDSSQDFNTATLTAAGNTSLSGIWSDGITMWVADSLDNKIYAYNLTTKAYDSSKDFNSFATANNNARGIWSDGTTMWVVDLSNKIYAYNLATKAYASNKDITLDADSTIPFGIWSDGATMWVADLDKDKIYAYDLGFIVAATAESSTQIALSWDAVTGTSIYRVYRSTQVAGVYTALTPVASTSTTDGGLAGGTTYYYQISACTLDNTADSAGASCSDRNHAAAQASATTMAGSGKILYNSLSNFLPSTAQQLQSDTASVSEAQTIATVNQQLQPLPQISTDNHGFATSGQCLQQGSGDNYWLQLTADASLLDANNSYRFGSEVYGDWDQLLSYANNNGLCGFNDWRIPTATELQQLYTAAGSFSKLQVLMPNILAQLYWSSTSSNNNNTAITVNLANGLLVAVTRSSYQRLILVRNTIDRNTIDN